MTSTENRYIFNELATVSLDLIYGFSDTSSEVTKLVENLWYAKYKGEFQNMGPKIRNMYTPNKDPFWTYVPLKYKFCS